MIGSNGYNDTVKYLVQELEALDGYYKVETQKFTSPIQTSGSGSLAIDSVAEESALFEFSPSGNVSAALAVVNNFGCDPVCFCYYNVTQVAQIVAYQELEAIGSCIKPLSLSLSSVVGVLPIGNLRA